MGMPLKEETDFQPKKNVLQSQNGVKNTLLQCAGINKPLIYALQTNLIPVTLLFGARATNLCGRLRAGAEVANSCLF